MYKVRELILRVLQVVLLASMLVGCMPKPTVVVPPIVPIENKTVTIPPAQLEYCKDIPKLPTDIPVDDIVRIEHYDQVFSGYSECSKKQRSLSKMVKDAFNIK